MTFSVPRGWTISRLGELAEVRLGKMLSQKARETGLIRRPYLRNENIRWGRIELDDVKTMGFKPEELDRYGVRTGDLLVCEGGEPGRCAVYRGGGSGLMYQKALHRVRVRDSISAELLQHWLRHLADSGALTPKIAQTTIQHLPLERFVDVEVPVPPKLEQQRIVAAIDQHLSDIDAGVASLARVQANLKRYRASVLKAACEGKLVPTEAELARKEGRTYESGAELLKRILVERRARWEADELAKMKAKGKVPAGDAWKEKYVEPAAPEAKGLPALPEGWCWTTVDALLAGIETGSSFKCDERPPTADEIGVVKVSAVSWGEYDEAQSKTCLDPDRIDPALFINAGDFLFSRANTIELVGACVIARHVASRVMLSDKILRFRVLGDAAWLLWCLRSRPGRDEIERLATGNQESMRNIGQERIRQIRVPLPPAAEAVRICAEITRLMAAADDTERYVTRQLARAARLRQAVLRDAFEGKLVAQMEDGERASNIDGERTDASSEAGRHRRRSTTAPVEHSG